MKVDFKSPIPLYFQIREQIREKILNKEYKFGDELPTEQQLCQTLNVSRYTVNQALEGLVQDGLIQRKKGKGTFVTYKLDFNSFSDMLGVVRGSSEFTLLEHVIIETPNEIKALFGEHAQPQVVYFARTQKEDGKVVSADMFYVPKQWAGELWEKPNQDLRVGRHIEEAFNIHLDYKMTYLTRLSNEKETKMMELKEPMPILIGIILETYENQVIAVHKKLFRGDMYCINIKMENDNNHKLNITAIDVTKDIEKYTKL